MAELEDKMLDSKREMQVADALDEIRTRNARIERTEALGDKADIATAQEKVDEEALRIAKEEDEEMEVLLQEFRAKQRAVRQAAMDAEIEEFNARIGAPPKNPYPWGKRINKRRRGPEGNALTPKPSKE